MYEKIKEHIPAGIVALIVAIVSSLVTSYFVTEHKLNNDERMKLNQNFKAMESTVTKFKNQEFVAILLLSKLVYTRKDWRSEDFREATEFLQHLKKNSDFDFDAVTMSLGSDKNEPCESFRKFYQKNKQMIHESHMGMLKEKIKLCIPKDGQLAE